MSESWTVKSSGRISEVFKDYEMIAPSTVGFGKGKFGNEDSEIFLLSIEGRGFGETKDKAVFFFDSLDSVKALLESVRASVADYEKGQINV